MVNLSAADAATREEIRAVLHAYCRGMDRKDWDLVRGTFHSHAVDEHGVVNGSIDELIEWTRKKHERVLQSMHSLTNISFLKQHADSVWTESYCSVHQTILRSNDEPVHLSIGCRYVDRFDLRTDWRIGQRAVRYEWAYHVGVSRDLLATSPELERSARDLTDPSYRLVGG